VDWKAAAKIAAAAATGAAGAVAAASVDQPHANKVAEGVKTIVMALFAIFF